MAINPVEVIAKARTRIARLAALAAATVFVAPAATALALSAFVPQIAAAVGAHLGYVLGQGALGATRLGFGLAAAALAVVGALRAWRAYRQRSDFVGTAEEIDEGLHAHQQVVTLAALADPAVPETARAGRRSALFPVLWRNVMAVLEGFDPGSAFRLDVGKPLARSSLYAAAVVAALGIVMLALARPPTPLQKTALRLREIARKIEKTAATPEDRALATAVRKAAEDLANPTLPPEQKMEELKNVMRDVEKREKETAAGEKAKAAGGTGSGGSASKNASGRGGGEGKGTAPEEGSGAGPGTGKEQRKQAAGETVELKNEIAKAEAQVETGEASEKKPSVKPSAQEKAGNAPSPGENPNLKGGGSQKDQSGPGAIPVPKLGETQANAPPNAARKGRSSANGGSFGDTHLGEFPAPANYQRFYKPGEKGAKLEIRDARYVMFRLPGAIAAEGGGKMVTDAERPRAETPYTNAPLKPTADNAPPDERQLVPPRYRDLIR